MTIVIDADDMGVLSRRLNEAAQEIIQASPVLPASGSFGPPVLAAAVASFESTMRRKAEGLSERWSTLDAGVSASLDDFVKLESEIISGLERIQGSTL